MTNNYEEYDVTDESRYESMLVALLLYPPALELELFSGIYEPISNLTSPRTSCRSQSPIDETMAQPSHVDSSG